MKTPKYLKMFLVSFLSLSLSNVPAVALAHVKLQPTSAAVDEWDRTQALARVNVTFHREDLRRELQKRGIGADEISRRLASLSDAELRQLSGQLDQARAGGDILFTILIIVLIIFLIKRL